MKWHDQTWKNIGMKRRDTTYKCIMWHERDRYNINKMTWNDEEGNEIKWNEAKQCEIKRNGTEGNETKWNEINEMNCDETI